MKAIDANRSRKSLASFGVAALLAVTAATAQVTAGPTAIDATGHYEKEVQACMSGQTQQDRETCLREARNAQAEKKRGARLVVGGTASLAFAVTTARASTINADAAMDWAVGTAAASNVTLATTMVDVIAKVDKTLDGADAAYTTASTANVAAAAAHDRTGTAKDLYLNVSFPTATDVDGDGTLAVTGTITILWELWGDY